METVLASTNVSEDKRKVYGTVDQVKKFDNFFMVRKNMMYIIYERARFSHRNQLQGEKSEQ